MRIFGFKYCTGVSYCDLDEEVHGNYKEVAYVWENGDIDWRVSPETLNDDGVAKVLKCSLMHRSNVENLRAEFSENYKKYKYLLNTENKGLSLKEFNMKHWLHQKGLELLDLTTYKTTCVVH